MKSYDPLLECSDIYCKYYNSLMELHCSYSNDNSKCWKQEEQSKCSESSSDINTASGDFWRDAKNDLPAKTGVYATYTYPTQHAGEIYSCELYSRKHGGWCEADHDIDLWCELPDPSQIRESEKDAAKPMAHDAVLCEVRARIADDLRTMKRNGLEHKTVGHIRALKIIDEYISQQEV